MSVRVLDERDVRRLLPMAECIDVMADALAAVSRGDVYNPLRVMARPPGEESLLGLMPVHRGGDRPLYALKSLAIFPSNAERGLDLHQGFVALFDGHTGETRAILTARAMTCARLRSLAPGSRRARTSRRCAPFASSSASSRGGAPPAGLPTSTTSRRS